MPHDCLKKVTGATFLDSGLLKFVVAVFLSFRQQQLRVQQLFKLRGNGGGGRGLIHECLSVSQSGIRAACSPKDV